MFGRKRVLIFGTKNTATGGYVHQSTPLKRRWVRQSPALKGTPSSVKFGSKRMPLSKEVQSHAGLYWSENFAPKKGRLIRHTSSLKGVQGIAVVRA